VSSQRELAALLASRGLAGFAAGLSGMMGALSPGAGTYGTSNGSPVLDQLQKDLAALQNQAVNSGPATAATAGQLKTLTQQAQQLQQQLIQQGNSPQAQKLRDQLNQLMQTLAAPPAPAAPPPASSGTLSVPPVHP
jgi:septal ring factor EnvC (AmiA/AmiB activator)